MWHLKYDTKEFIYETETDSQTIEKRLVIAKREEEEGEGRIGSLGLAEANYYI